MKQTMRIALILLALSFVVSGEAVAADQWKQYQEKEHSFFHSLWGKMKSLMPKRHTANQHVTAVIGVRGAETTQTALNPHWENDLASNPSFQSDMKAFESAGTMCKQGDAGEGTREFEGLLQNSSFQSIQSNGLLALAACYNQQGEQKKSIAYLKQFVKKYPKHPMAQDVKKFISDMEQ